MSEELQQKLRDQLWEVANRLRGNMSASDFMYFTLGFIFYKYLSEKIETYANSALDDDEVTFKELWEMTDSDAPELQEEVKNQCLENIGYFIEPKFLFSSVIEAIKRKENVLPMLERSLKRIEDSTLGQDSEEDFGGLFSDIDLASPKLGKTADDKNTLVSNVLLALDDIDFGVEASQEIDILGDAYEYMISQFAAGAGKKAGEFYTPSGPAELLCRLACLGLTDVKDAADPTCGSGSLLLRLKNYANVRNYYGQELTSTTYNLARMNMILRGIPYRNFNIYNGDTLEHDYFGDMKFRVQVANPPYSANWSADMHFMEDERFNEYGKLAPKSKADFAFVQHMVYHMDEDGRAVVLLPHGVLFRGGAEARIRTKLLKDGHIDTVIGLPANLFFSTGIPVCILVLKKCKKPDDVLFINASECYDKGKRQNQLLRTDEMLKGDIGHIEKIIDTYQFRKEETRYSRRVSMNEIEKNDFNLNISRYVSTAESEEEIDLAAVHANLLAVEGKITEAKQRHNEYLKELGLPLLP